MSPVGYAHSRHGSGLSSQQGAQDPRHVKQDILQSVAPRATDLDDGESLSLRGAGHVCALIDRNEGLEPRLCGGGDELAIFQATPSSVSRGLDIMAVKMVTKVDGEAIVDQNAHSARISDHAIFRLLNHRNRLFPTHVGKVFQESIKRVTGFEVVEEGSHENASVRKDRSTPQHVLIPGDRVNCAHLFTSSARARSHLAMAHHRTPVLGEKR